MKAVAKKTDFVMPFKPCLIHNIYQWIEQLPGPYWLLSLLIVVVTGGLNHIVAWNHNVLKPYEFSWPFALTGFYLAFNLVVNDFLFRTAQKSLAESRQILDVSEDEFQQILFEFLHLPAKQSALYFFAGAVTGFSMGWVLLPTAPEMNYAFPELELTMYTLSMGLIFITLFGIFRALKLISRLFDKEIDVDIYNQSSIYAMSRYSAWLIVTVSIQVSLTFIIIPTFAEITSYFFIVFLLFVYCLMLAIFWLPLRGINRKMKLKKQEMLQEVNQRIKTTFRILHTKIDKQDYLEVKELREVIESLKAEKVFIEAIKTWPWKPSTLTGLLSLVLLPLLGNVLLELITKIIFSR
jgi:hypothetical protein